MRLDDFWRSSRWLEYELAYGDAQGTRSAQLAAAMWRTRVVDLARPVEALWRDVRRSYHALIHRAERVWPMQVMTDTDVGVDLPGPRVLHAVESGRVTRPLRTWALMADWTRAESGLCVSARDDDPPYHMVGFAYFIRDGAWGYYASAATVRRDLNHAIVWRAMLELRSSGVRWLEMGWQGEAQGDKGKSIEFFRRGFGGADLPLDAELA